MQQSSILRVCQEMLSFNSSEEEVYYLKLEALWLLINLAYTQQMGSLLLLASNLDYQL